MAERICRTCGHSCDRHGRIEPYSRGDGQPGFRWVPPQDLRAGPIVDADRMVCLHFAESPIIEGVL